MRRWPNKERRCTSPAGLVFRPLPDMAGGVSAGRRLLQTPAYAGRRRASGILPIFVRASRAKFEQCGRRLHAKQASALRPIGAMTANRSGGCSSRGSSFVLLCAGLVMAVLIMRGRPGLHRGPAVTISDAERGLAGARCPMARSATRHVLDLDVDPWHGSTALEQMLIASA